MAYQVLARKWRPKTFADLVGQEHVVKALRNALDEGRLHHAYLLTGTRGVGKTTIARILAKSLNCEHPDHGEPCGECQSCTQIDAGRYVDLLEIDAASNTGIDNIREVLENAQYAPTAGKYKVYIIDEVHMLSKSAFNAMLKTLEEPPEHVKFILATTDPHKVPITVLSRCLQFVLRNMTTQQVAEHLAKVLDKEQIAYEPAALQLLGRAAAGSMRDALSLLDQAIAMGSGSVAEQDVRQMIGAVDKQYLYELLNGIVAQDGAALLDKAQEMAARAIGFDSALADLAMLLQRLALIQAVPSALANDDPERDALLALSQGLSGEQIQLYYQCVIHGKKDLPLAPDEYGGFVMTLLRMLAFAPMAAAVVPADGVIEHTQLHDGAQVAAKKPEAAARPSETAAVGTAVAPPKADMPKTPIQTGAQAAIAEAAAAPQESVAETAVTSPDVPPTAAAATVVAQDSDVPPWEDLAQAQNAVEPKAADIQTASASSENTAAAPAVPSEKTIDISAPTVPFVESMTEVPKQTDDNRYAEDECVYADEPPAAFADYSDGVTYDTDDDEYADVPPPPDFAAATLAAEDEDEEAGDDEPQFAPLPEFAPENWAAVVQRFAHKLGAAQMLAQNAAWTRYDDANHLMVLALTEEARKTTNKERLDKIQSVLADAYGLPLVLQTEAWRDEAGWETPVMRRQRLQREGRQQAQDFLEADPTAQQIMQAFDAHWQPDTLELLENR
ncbi:DNA polymerase III subunit gamma/tau [Neisseria perflava]|uniref:DNA polymerase III subunit gamma/tau n=1 Tax=Neisseria perflava TaxID=33053 RepID=UPI00209E6C79|nr:DNA polymerase III subunit gamma/tau [Neisseria perflava]MCP1660344.1 DNA polymerase-3 subunit gamma/tau [Neisseria perflava]